VPWLPLAPLTDTPNVQNAQAIAKGIISMAHSLELTVMAEGVETEAQVDLLSTMGCDHMQGFFFSRPVPADDISRLLKATIS
jgi:EAL domain-containing protein (putative c-di-GMP-specific phosphodiesterase class I)